VELRRCLRLLRVPEVREDLRAPFQCHDPASTDVTLWAAGPLRLALPLDLRVEALLLRSQLRRELLAEVVGLEHRPDLDDRLLAGHRVRAAPDPLERLLHGPHLPEPEAGDELLGLGKGAVDHAFPTAREHDALAL